MRKVNVNTARKMFDAENTVYLLPNKVRLGSVWIQPCAIDNKCEESFDSHVNAYRYYNCNNEVGNSVAYYVSE